MNPIEFALSGLTEIELAAIAQATYAKPSPPGVSGLMAWIESALDVERHRRAGIDLPLPPPSAAIDESYEVAALKGAIALRDTAPDDRIHALFDAVVNVLTRVTRH